MTPDARSRGSRRQLIDGYIQRCQGSVTLEYYDHLNKKGVLNVTNGKHMLLTQPVRIQSALHYSASFPASHLVEERHQDVAVVLKRLKVTRRRHRIDVVEGRSRYQTIIVA